jgi:hypothetical protein
MSIRLINHIRQVLEIGHYQRLVKLQKLNQKKELKESS